MSAPRLTREEAIRLGVGELWPKPPPSRHEPDGMNKTERRLSRILHFMQHQGDIRAWDFAPEKFRMADKTWYTPDFRVTLPDAHNLFVEVKVRKKDGSILWKDDAAVKIKTIAELQPYPFFLAVYDPTGWEITRLPSRNWGWIPVNLEWRV